MILRLRSVQAMAAMKSIGSGVQGDAVGGDGTAVGVPAFWLRAFDLDAEKSSLVLDGKIAGSAQSPEGLVTRPSSAARGP
jgi:hypothetical protein